MFASTYVTTDPAWPWSLPGVGVSALLGIALALALLTVWTYLGVRQATRRHITIVVVLRLLALAIALIIVLRPSLAQDEEDTSLASKLLVHVDISDSMNVTDAFNNRSRYEDAKRLLTTAPIADLLKKLAAERKIEIVYTMGADDVRSLDFPAKPTGKRTDIGGWLHELWQKHGQEPNLRGLVLLTDGADNGTRFAAVEKADQYRGVCKIYPFALGETTTTTSAKDVAIQRVWVEPTPVHAKGKMSVKASLTVPGFEDAVLNASVWIEDEIGKPMRQLSKQAVDLRRLPDKVVAFPADAPDKDGEVKITVKVEPLPGEVNAANNEASTYVNVSKEGVSILWVEGKLRYETSFALRALAKDGRLRVFHAVKLPGGKAAPDHEDWFNFDKRHYDVIVIGDIAAERFSGGKPEVFDKIMHAVQTKGTGLLMLAGYDTFAVGGWQASRIASLLPCKFDQAEQIEAKIKVKPTPAGEQFLLKLALDPAKQKELWGTKLESLEGMTSLGSVEPTATVYAHATSEAGKAHGPLMASVDRGQGRVMVFGGDTTHLAWRRSPEAVAAYEVFWTQLMLWLAKQEHSKGNLLVRPDTRRLDLGKNERLGFSVTFNKGAGKVQKTNFKSKIVGPGKTEFAVNILPESNDFRGSWTGPPKAGEYRIEVEGEGVDDKGQPVRGKDSARFMVYDEDLETTRPAADHDLLQKIAVVSGGSVLTQERDLVKLLEELTPLQDPGRTTALRWPDWRRNPVSDGARDQISALWQSSALPCFLAFTALLCLEWLLRRRWGMV